MPHQFDDTRTQHRQHESDGESTAPAARETRSSHRRELYSALMDGLGRDEQAELERLVTANVERLRETGDGYAP